MSLNATEQLYLDFALAALPRWMRSDDYHLRGSAKLFGAVQAQTDYWFGQALIGTATGAGADTPDWLRQHARDRATDRQIDETDVALRARIRSVPDSLTRQTLIDAANAILAAAGVAGSAAMIELPRDGAFSGSFTSNTGTGGVFAAGTGTAMIFTPTVPFARAPFRDPSVVRRIQGFRLDITGAAHSGNNGNRATTGMLGNGAIVTNASGFAGADATVTWTVRKLDRRGNVLDGRGQAFASRGFRSSHPHRPLNIVMILPYGSTSAIQTAVAEMLRQRKAAGFIATVERRLSP